MPLVVSCRNQLWSSTTAPSASRTTPYAMFEASHQLSTGLMATHSILRRPDLRSRHVSVGPGRALAVQAAQGHPTQRQPMLRLSLTSSPRGEAIRTLDSDPSACRTSGRCSRFVTGSSTFKSHSRRHHLTRSLSIVNFRPSHVNQAKQMQASLADHIRSKSLPQPPPDHQE